MSRGVEIQELRKHFRIARWRRFKRSVSEVTAVDGINICVPAGQAVAFIGPNGAGKSTTIKMLTGLLAPTRGTIRVLGRDMLDPSEALTAKRSMGCVAKFNPPSRAISFVS